MNSEAVLQSQYQQLRKLPVPDLRLRIRQGLYNSHTGGFGSGMLQTNLPILPEEYALDFMRYYQGNPKP